METASGMNPADNTRQPHFRQDSPSCYFLPVYHHAGLSLSYYQINKVIFGGNELTTGAAIVWMVHSPPKRKRGHRYRGSPSLSKDQELEECNKRASQSLSADIIFRNTDQVIPMVEVSYPAWEKTFHAFYHLQCRNQAELQERGKSTEIESLSVTADHT